MCYAVNERIGNIYETIYFLSVCFSSIILYTYNHWFGSTLESRKTVLIWFDYFVLWIKGFFLITNRILFAEKVCDSRRHRKQFSRNHNRSWNMYQTPFKDWMIENISRRGNNSFQPYYLATLTYKWSRKFLNKRP